MIRQLLLFALFQCICIKALLFRATSITSSNPASFKSSIYECNMFDGNYNHENFKEYSASSMWDVNVHNSGGNAPVNEANSRPMYQRSERIEIPQRFDTCMMLVSGIIGVEPKEIFFKNGNYLNSFPIAVVGHFTPAHEGERLKPTETMWLPSEMWNGVARSHNMLIKKGLHIHAFGNLIASKWTDKTSGEERKQFRFRITKVLKSDEFQAIAASTEQATDHSLMSIDEVVYDQTYGLEHSGATSQIPNPAVNQHVKESRPRLWSKPATTET